MAGGGIEESVLRKEYFRFLTGAGRTPDSCTNIPPLYLVTAAGSRAVRAGATVRNAVVSALSTLGISHIDMPATAFNVWQAISNARSRMA
jgi:hypothetical protein